MKKWKKIVIVIAIILGILLAAGVAIQKNPRLRVLMSVLLFTETTMNEPSYIAYGIDLMDMCQNYSNGDTVIYGKANLNDLKGFGFSSSMQVTGERSFAQKKMSMHADMDVLFLNVGEFDSYVDENTIYMVVPMLDNLSYAFTSSNELFQKAPELTSDISQEWFRNHMTDISRMLGQVSIEETGEMLDDDGVKSREYRITIPAGVGDFLWELLGMETPDYDISCDIYLTPGNRIRRVEMNLDDIMRNTSLVLDGTDMSKAIVTMELPDDERFVMTMVRNGSYTYTNYMDVDMVYYVNQGENLTASTYVTWQKEEGRISMDIHKTEIKKGDEVQATCTFTGYVEKRDSLDDVFSDVEVDLDSIEKIDWKKLRSDTEGFVNDVMEEVKSRVF